MTIHNISGKLYVLADCLNIMPVTPHNQFESDYEELELFAQCFVLYDGLTEIANEQKTHPHLQFLQQGTDYPYAIKKMLL